MLRTGFIGLAAAWLLKILTFRLNPKILKSVDIYKKYQSKLLYHYEILQEHSCWEDRQLHPDGDHRLRINIPHAVMRHITLIVIHCSAVRPDQTSSAAQIDTWHRQRGIHTKIARVSRTSRKSTLTCSLNRFFNARIWLQAQMRAFLLSQLKRPARKICKKWFWGRLGLGSWRKMLIFANN